MKKIESFLVHSHWDADEQDKYWDNKEEYVGYAKPVARYYTGLSVSIADTFHDFWKGAGDSVSAYTSLMFYEGTSYRYAMSGTRRRKTNRLLDEVEGYGLAVKLTDRTLPFPEAAFKEVRNLSQRALRATLMHYISYGLTWGDIYFYAPKHGVLIHIDDDIWITALALNEASRGVAQDFLHALGRIHGVKTILREPSPLS